MSKYQTIKGKRHYVFQSAEELRDSLAGDDFVLCNDWRGAEVGDWVKADDGGRVHILARGEIGKGQRKSTRRFWVRTVGGTFCCYPRS